MSLSELLSDIRKEPQAAGRAEARSDDLGALVKAMETNASGIVQAVEEVKLLTGHVCELTGAIEDLVNVLQGLK